jgi:hypothetical protein
MKVITIPILECVQRFLNNLPNRRFEEINSYTLAAEMDHIVPDLKEDLVLRKEIKHLLKGLKKDAEMALSGEWDCTTKEGIETGFNAQITLINNMLEKIKIKD